MPQEIRFEHRMSDADALMWKMEKDPLLRSTITVVWLLDSAPDHKRLSEKIERATRVVPRLRQRVVANPLSIAPPRFEVDPNFDPSFHVRFGSGRRAAAPCATCSIWRSRWPCRASTVPGPSGSSLSLKGSMAAAPL